MKKNYRSVAVLYAQNDDQVPLYFFKNNLKLLISQISVYVIKIIFWTNSFYEPDSRNFPKSASQIGKAGWATTKYRKVPECLLLN